MVGSFMLVVLVNVLCYVLFSTAHGCTEFSLYSVFKLFKFVEAHDLHAGEFTLACHTSVDVVAFVFGCVMACGCA